MALIRKGQRFPEFESGRLGWQRGLDVSYETIRRRTIQFGPCKTAEEARRKAERLAPLRLGVVAFAASADTEMGDYDESPTILFKSGQLPPPWNEE